MSDQSPYEILEIPITATQRDIKIRYRDLVRQYSPEHQPEKFMEIRAAYDELMDTSMEAREFFPMYKKPLDFLTEEGVENLQNTTQQHLLSSIFETPFDTVEEIEQLFKRK